MSAREIRLWLYKTRRRRKAALARRKAKTLAEVFMEEKVKALLTDIERKSALGEIR